jgi:hypothetical protein
MESKLNSADPSQHVITYKIAHHNAYGALQSQLLVLTATVQLTACADGEQLRTRNSSPAGMLAGSGGRKLRPVVGGPLLCFHLLRLSSFARVACPSTSGYAISCNCAAPKSSQRPNKPQGTARRCPLGTRKAHASACNVQAASAANPAAEMQPPGEWRDVPTTDHDSSSPWLNLKSLARATCRPPFVQRPPACTR